LWYATLRYVTFRAAIAVQHLKAPASAASQSDLGDLAIFIRDAANA
jgi:hypothetical protein